jgi:hypothetical protein
MSLEHSPARQKPRSSITGHSKADETIADDLMLGAGPIAFFIYGADTPEMRRNVYRNVFNLPLFKHGNTLAAFKSVIRTALMEAGPKAALERQRKAAAEAAKVVKPRRGRRSLQQKVEKENRSSA